MQPPVLAVAVPRVASSIITTMMGTPITPLSTADQNSAFTGSAGVKHNSTSPRVAASTAPEKPRSWPRSSRRLRLPSQPAASDTA